MGDQIVQTYLGDIAKSARAEDGTLIVTGTASDSNTDNDGQVCDPTWLKSAMPEWFQWGNIREQHSKIAAGLATELNVSDDGASFIAAKVVDPVSAKKVEERVLKGFSIGIKNPKVVKVAGDTKAPNGRIVGGQIIEVSLVDRPANANCKLQLAKSEDGAKVEPDETLYDEKANYPSDPKLEACITKLADDEDMKKKHPDAAQRKSHAIAICRANFGKGVEDAEIIKTSYLTALDAIEKADKPNPFAADDKTKKKKVDPKTGKPIADDDEDDPKVKLDASVLEKLADGASHTFVRKDDGTVEIDGEIVTEAPAPSSGPVDYERLADMIADRMAPKVTDATKALEERVAKIEKSPAGGGPVRMGGVTAANAQHPQAAALIGEAERLDKMASETSNDRRLSDGYKLLAKRKRDEAAALVKA